MPSPTASAQSLEGRNPRRRQRGSEDGLSIRQQPLRKRSRLNRDLFKPSDSGSVVNGVAITNKALMNGHIASPGGSNGSASPLPSEIPFRGNPRHAPAKGGARDDGTTTLTKNANYTVKQLPCLPNQFRSNKTGYRGACVTPSGHALTLTRTQALIWDYTTSAAVPATQTLALPYPAKNDEPIPLGAFVTSGSSSDTGLVVVNATTGRISFWESIENADALSLFEQRRNGVEGSCGSLSFGETITDITDADPAGFVLSFSSGRTAQLLVRDSQSRPSIAVTFLRSNASASAGGFFGSLRNVFGGAGYLRSVAAVQTRIGSSRGQTEAIISSEDALFQFWQLSWSSSALLQKEIDARSAVTEAIAQIHAAELKSLAQNPKVVDFVIDPSTSDYLNMVVLVSLGAGSNQSFALVRIEIEDNDIPAARRTILLHSYSAPLVPKSSWKPKLCLPTSGSTAFVVFEKAIVLVSLAAETSDPNSQNLIDAGEFPEPYQDTIYFRDETDFFACGAMVEGDGERLLDPSVIVFVQNFGLLRTSATAPSLDPETQGRTQVTAKSKIEQAVFFGALPSNPLNLARKTEAKFPIEEVEEAALSISQDILSTNSVGITAVAPSMEIHLEQRAKNLKNLAIHLRQFYPNISRVTKWELRWDAEKMAAARRVWSLCDQRRKRGKRDLRLLTEMLISIDEEHKTEMNPDRGESDLTRHFFLKDVSQMQILLGWPYFQLKMSKESGAVRDTQQFFELMSEANDIVVGGLSAAFEFRSAHAELYGLEDEPVKEGLLSRGYEELPEFWTSHPVVWLKMPDHIKALHDLIEEDGDEFTSIEQAPPDLQKITLDFVNLIDLYCKTSEESCRWFLSRTDEKNKLKGQTFLDEYRHKRVQMITGLPDVFLELADNGMELAEKYADMKALVGVISERSEILKLCAETGDPDMAAEATQKGKALEKKVRSCLQRYGTAFADEMYMAQIRDGKVDTFLEQAKPYGKEVTQFLRDNSSVKKLGWINEAMNEHNHFLAGRDLMDVAVGQETELWSKKVELSIAKLALIAAANEGPAEEELEASKSAQADAMQLVKIQEKIFEHVRPSLYGAVDEAGEREIAMEAFGSVTVKGAPKLQQLLEHGMEKLVGHQAMGADQLIDVLTLMDQRHCEVKPYDICGQESLLALEALKHAGLGKERQRFELSLRIIWRRCFLKDDWEVLNDTARKSDQDAMEDLESTTLFKTVYEGFAQGLWEGASGVRMLSPKEVLGAGTKPDEHSGRFSSADLREPIAKEMAIDDENLRGLVKRYRLEHWYAATKELAERRWKGDGETKENLAQNLGTTTKAIYEEDADLKRGGEKCGINIPRTWREAVRMGLGVFR